MLHIYGLSSVFRSSFLLWLLKGKEKDSIMVKYLVCVLLLAVACNAYTLNAGSNAGTNFLSPFAQIHHNHLQNSYDYRGGFTPFNNLGQYGYAGLGGINIRMPINQDDNFMSPGALITTSNSQNAYRF